MADRVCSICSTLKTDADYYEPASKQCRSCVSDMRKADYAAKAEAKNAKKRERYQSSVEFREDVARRSREWREKNHERAKARFQKWHRLTTYGVSDADFIDMMAKQNDACDICREPFGEKTPLVDHCHQTGKVRGLLCRKCNTGLGQFRDDLNVVNNARDYLMRHRGDQ